MCDMLKLVEVFLRASPGTRSFCSVVGMQSAFVWQAIVPNATYYL
jgi:hypothetical protein